MIQLFAPPATPPADTLRTCYRIVDTAAKAQSPDKPAALHEPPSLSSEDGPCVALLGEAEVLQTFSAPVCRICLFGEEEGDLIAPCGCRGTHRFTHADCLNQWRLMHFDSAEKRDVCGVCQTKYLLRQSSLPGESERILYRGALHAVATLCLVPAALATSVVLPLLRRRTRTGVLSEFGVDSESLSASEWRADVFGPFLRKSVLANVNRIARHRTGGWRLLARGVWLPGLLWGACRLGSFGFTSKYFFFNATLFESIPVLGPRTRHWPPSVVILLNYLLFCLSLRCIRTPARVESVPLYFLCNALGLAFVQAKLFVLVRQALFALVPRAAQIEVGMLRGAPVVE